MFMKTNKNYWINLNTCRKLEIQKCPQGEWQIIFFPMIIDPNPEVPDSIGTFRLEGNAHEVLDEIWEAYREGKPYFELDPREELNVRLGDKWYGEENPIDTYIEVIQRLGLEEIEKRGLIFKDKSVPKHEGRLIITTDKVPRAKQKRSGEYYILLPDYPTTMKEILKNVASELEVELEVTIYQ